MRNLILISILLGSFSMTKVNGADLVVVINTLECNNYYRSAPLLSELKGNLNIKFIFPEYEKNIAVKYLNEKFNLNWDQYEINYNDSLFKYYRKNNTSECVYFPDESKKPLFSLPLAQLDMSFSVLKAIPSNIKVDTIPVDPRFLLSGEMSVAFDSSYVYILEAQFGGLLEMDQKNYSQRVISLSDLFTYDKIRNSALSVSEISQSDSIQAQITDKRAMIRKMISFSRISTYGNQLYIRASLEFYRQKEKDRIGIYTRDFILRITNKNFDEPEVIILPSVIGYYHNFGPAFINADTICLSIGINPSKHLALKEKYLIAKYTYNNQKLKFEGFDAHNVLPPEYTRLDLNYNFLNYITYKNHFTFPYTKRIHTVGKESFDINLLPDIDTLKGSKIPDVKTNYMMLGIATEYSITNFIAKFDDGKVMLFSYDYEHNLPFNQIELPVKIKTLWPYEDFFKFISINSFIHINLRNQFIVKYYW